MAKSNQQWDGKLYRPAKFGEGMQPGTVEWAQKQRQKRREREYFRQIVRDQQAQQAPSRPSLWSRLARLFRS